MAIKQFNPVVPNMERPLQLTDLQEFWDALNQVFDNQEFRVIAGLNYADSGGFLSAGVASYQGQLYYYDGGDDIAEGTTLYYAKVAGTNRTFSNGISYPFDYSFIITSDEITGGGTLLPASRNNAAYLNSRRLGAIAAGSITNDKLAQNAVTADKLDNAIAPAYLTGKTTKSFTSPTFNLTLADFILPNAGLDAHTQTRYVEVTTSYDSNDCYLNITGVPQRTQKLKPDSLTLIVKPPVGKKIQLLINGAASDSASPVSINFKASFEPVANPDGGGFLPSLIVCYLKKITETDYAVINAYQTTSFNLPF